MLITDMLLKLFGRLGKLNNKMLITNFQKKLKVINEVTNMLSTGK
jgi:hypothetical protein